MRECCFQMPTCFLLRQFKPQTERQGFRLHQRNRWSADLHLLQIWLNWHSCYWNWAIGLFDHQPVEEHSPLEPSLGRAFRYQPSFMALNWQYFAWFDKYPLGISETVEAYQKMTLLRWFRTSIFYHPVWKLQWQIWGQYPEGLYQVNCSWLSHRTALLFWWDTAMDSGAKTGTRRRGHVTCKHISLALWPPVIPWITAWFGSIFQYVRQLHCPLPRTLVGNAHWLRHRSLQSSGLAHNAEGIVLDF